MHSSCNRKKLHLVIHEFQHVELDLGHEDFYCPATGERVLGEDSFEPSPATEFAFTDEGAEYFAKAPTGETRKSRIVIFSITTSGDAGGSIRNSVHVGINMNFR